MIIEKMTGKDFSEDLSFGFSINQWALPRSFKHTVAFSQQEK